MKFMKNNFTLILIFLLLVFAFFAGSFLNPLINFDSCGSALNYLKQSNLCVGKFEEYVGTSDVLGNIEWFDYNWQEDIGDYGHTKEEIAGPNEQCYWQGYRQYIETGIHESLVDCFVNEVEIGDDELIIGCGCFFE